MARLRKGGFLFARIFLIFLLYAIPVPATLAQNGLEHIRDTGLDAELALEGNYLVQRNDGSEPFPISVVRSAVELCSGESHRDHPRCSQLLIPGPGGWVSAREGWRIDTRASTSDFRVEADTISLRWNYVRTSRLRASPAGSLTGIHGRPEDGVTERWEQVKGRVTHFGFAASGRKHFRESTGGPTFPVSGLGRVEADYDSWHWAPQNGMRGNRPQVFLQLFGDHLWGLNYIEFEGPGPVQAGMRGGFEPAWPSFICRGENGEIFTNSSWTSCAGGAVVIGLQIALVAWADVQPGEYTVRINGEPLVFDLVIHGWPGGSSAPDSLDFETPVGQPLESLGEGGALRLVAQFEAPPETDSIEAQLEGVQIGQAGWDGSIVPVTLSRSAEPNVYHSQTYFLTASGSAQTARMRADSTRFEQVAVDRFFAGTWQVRHRPQSGTAGEAWVGGAEIDAESGGLLLSLADPSGVERRWRAYDFQPGYFPDDPVVSGLTARFVADRPELEAPGAIVSHGVV